MSPEVHGAVSPRYAGTRVQRVEDGRLLIGRGGFVDDILRPGMLHACFVRSPFARARINGIDVTRVPPYERPVNMMFQSYALFPHMTVAQNVAYGLKARAVPPAAMAERVARALRLVQLAGFAGNRAEQAQVMPQ